MKQVKIRVVKRGTNTATLSVKGANERVFERNAMRPAPCLKPNDSLRAEWLNEKARSAFDNRQDFSRIFGETK